MHKEFVACNCNGSSVAPLTDYINNTIYQELIDENDYINTSSDERKYLDFRTSSEYTTEAEKLEWNDLKTNLHLLFKAAATAKLRVKVE